MDYLEAINGMFEELVPAFGKAETKAGELVRAVTRIGGRYWNDGDKIGVGYGKEVCNPPALFILSEYGETDFAGTIVAMWGLEDDETYEKGLELLIREVVDYIEEHPKLRKVLSEVDCVKDFVDDVEVEESTTFVEPWAVYDPEWEG